MSSNETGPRTIWPVGRQTCLILAPAASLVVAVGFYAGLAWLLFAKAPAFIVGAWQ